LTSYGFLISGRLVKGTGTLKRLTLRLSGNDPAIVLDGVDPKEVAPKIDAGAMFNAGHACIVIKRRFVHDSIDDAVRDELGKLAPGMVVR
jgi:acyl-CoA reductase-like NAD-dependent aldehyde dehydrogenase